MEKSSPKSLKDVIRSLPKSAYPKNVKPMLATLTDKSFDDDGWLFEIKWDGWRMIGGLNNGDSSLTTRNLQDYTLKFPAVVKALNKIKKSMVLDGEIVALNQKGISEFQLLQNYQRTKRGQIVYYLFDILWYDGHSLENLKLIQRKEILKSLIPKSEILLYSDEVKGKGTALFKAAQKQGLEGIIAKESDSKYHEGIRTGQWLKIKTEMRQEAIICGFTEPRNSREHFGALILGVYENKKLIYIGHTGTGFNTTSLKQISDKLKSLIQKTSPFEKIPKTNSPVTWLKPRLICEVRFSNWTDEGLMRHPVFEGLREDKRPEHVVRER